MTKRFNRQFSPRAGFWIAAALFVAGITLAVLTRSLPFLVHFTLWVAPISLAGLLLAREILRREAGELPPQRRIDGTYEDDPHDR